MSIRVCRVVPLELADWHGEEAELWAACELIWFDYPRLDGLPPTQIEDDHESGLRYYIWKWAKV